MDSLKILVVDDDPDVRRVLREILKPHYRLLEAPDAASAIELAEVGEPEAVLLDLHLGDGPDGFSVLEKLQAIDPDLPVVILSAYHDTDTVVRAMKAGAAHFIDKTPRYDELAARLQRAVEERRRALQLQAHRLPPTRFVGTGPRVKELLDAAREAAGSDLPVLILGETGTGKSLLARLIHRWGQQRDGPFLEANVAALPSSILNSELFGHEKGAFTGAEKRHRGLFELATGGTILLDEIGDLSRRSQVKLLQVVEEGRFRRVGGEEDLVTSVRVLSATHRDLAGMMESGAFRTDLYFRLAGLVISVPPLREHPESIPLLVEGHLGDAFTITEPALDRLMRHSWRGNVRELQLALGRAKTFAQAGLIDTREIERSLDSHLTGTGWKAPDDLFHLEYKAAKQELVSRFQRAYIERLLRRCRGNVSEAARQSAIARSYLHELIHRLDLGSSEESGDS